MNGDFGPSKIKANKDKTLPGLPLCILHFQGGSSHMAGDFEKCGGQPYSLAYALAD